MTSDDATSLEQYRQLFEDAPVAYHEIDMEGAIRSVNAAECALLGYQAAEMAGRPVWEFVAEEHREDSRATVFRKLAQELELRPFTLEFRRRDGRFLWLEIHESLVRDADGKVLGIRAALIDVTERRRAEEEIGESSVWLRTILHSIGDGVIATDVLGSVTVMNAVAERLTGWKQEVARGVPLEKVCKVVVEGDESGPVLWELLQETLSNGAVGDWSGLLRTRGKAREIKNVSLKISPISNERDEVMGTVVFAREAR